MTANPEDRPLGNPKDGPRGFMTLENVTIEARGRALFNDLSWHMLEGEQWAVVGPNASGKTTLLETIAGMHPHDGTITYHFPHKGDPYGHIALISFDMQRETLGQEPYLQDRWNIGLREKMPTVGELMPRTTRMKEVAGMLGIRSLLSRTGIELSNGERRKIAIARALLRRPKLLLLDNPLEGLDTRFRPKLLKNIEALMKSGARVIVAGTGREEMPRGITHVLHIRKNGAIEQGAIRAMKSKIGRYIALRTRSSTRARPRRMPLGRVLVEMNDVNVSYGDKPILKNFDWTVRQGEKWALLGPNGSGKTTLLSLILGDNPQAYANDIELFGKKRGSGESIWEIKKRIGAVSPELQLYYPQGASCLDVVSSGFFDSVGLYRRVSARERALARAWLDKFGLARRANTPIEDMSESEERLVLLARALVKDPLLLVLDEPCQGLDAKNRDRVLAAIERVARHPRRAMIYVTHRADELPKSITNILTLRKTSPLTRNLPGVR